MTTQILNLPVGSPQTFRPGPVPFNFCGQPSGTGSVLIDFSVDGGVTFTPTTLGNVTTANSFTNGNAGPGAGSTPGQYTTPGGIIVRGTATGAAGTLICSDMSQPVGGAGVERQTIAQSAVAYTLPVLTTEVPLFSMRLPPGLLKPNFRIEIDASVTLTNNAGVKTLRFYMGPSANTAIETAQAVFATQVVTSASGARVVATIGGRNDNQTTIGSSIGSAGGWGISTTANVVGTAQNYGGPTAVEQAIVVTGQKATGADVITLDMIVVKLFQ